MASITSSELSSVPATSILEIPDALQQSNDFGSVQAALSAPNPQPSSEGYDSIDWLRLPGWRIPIDDKRVRTWLVKQGHGWRLEKTKDGSIWWLCRRCHKLRTTRTHIFRFEKSTSGAFGHMRSEHNVDEKGVITKKRRIGDGGMERFVYGADAVTSMQNQHAVCFNNATFMTFLFDWIVTEGISFRQIESESLRAMLHYLQPRAVPPKRKALAQTIGRIYDSVLGQVTEALQSSITNINLSFDLWTSGNKLALLGIVACFINSSGTPTTVLLAMPRLKGRHTGYNQKESIANLIAEYGLEQKLGYFITHNAASNDLCLKHLAIEYGFDKKERWIRCFGHVLNLVAQAVLFGNDSEAFEKELNNNLTLEEMQLQLWRKKGPIGKLHNIVYWICRSPQRNERLMALQQTLIAPHRPRDKKATYELVKDIETRWNSFDDSAERALYLRPAIDELMLEVQSEHNKYVDRCTYLRRPVVKQPPAIIKDRLTPNDWHVIGLYHEILQPIKHWTTELQGHAGNDRFGAIWRVIQAYDHLLNHFERIRQQYPIINRSQVIADHLIQSQSQPTFNTCDSTFTSQHIALLPDEQTTDEHHFSTNVNLGWQKLEEYYNKLDDTTIYIAAVILHPRMKFRWLEKLWDDRSEWLSAARIKFTRLMLQYKDNTARPQSRQKQRLQCTYDEDDILSDEEDKHTSGIEQHFAAYEAEPRSTTIMQKDSPISYWLNQQRRWPQLAKLALDVYSTPVMSDEPERVFSATGAMIGPRRQLLSAETIQQIMCLRSWRQRGLFTWSRDLFEADTIFEASTNGNDMYTTQQVITTAAVTAIDSD
jgi:hypothetical protein